MGFGTPTQSVESTNKTFAVYYGPGYNPNQNNCVSDPKIGCPMYFNGMQQVPLNWMIVSNIT